ncbi:insulinase family protein, partial [bacterium]|nr:insulinase family protein [bacterium]
FYPREMTELLEKTYGKAKPGNHAVFQKEAPRLSPSWNPVRLLGEGTHLWLAFPWQLIRGEGRLEPVETLLPDILDVIIGDTLRERFKGDILTLDWSWEINRSGTQLQLRMELSPEADIDYILNFIQLKLTTLDPTSASLALWRDKANAAVDDAIYYSQRYHFFGMLQAAEIAQGSCRLWAQNMREMVAFRDMLESARVGSPGIMKMVSEAVPLVVIFTPPPVESEETEFSYEKTDTTLANGLRLIIKSESSMPVFAAHFLFQERSAIEGPERMGWVDMLHRLIEYGNPPSYGKAELQRRLDSLRLRWQLVDSPYIPFDNYFTQPDFSFIRLSGPTLSQQAGLALIYELLRSDALDPSDLEAVRNEMYGLIQREERSPKAKAEAVYQQALLGAHPYAQDVSGNTATISAPDPFDLRQFRKDYFRPNHLILSIVTSESIDNTVAMVEAVFGAWKSGNSLPEIPKLPAPRDSIVTITVGARQAQIQLGALLPMFSEDQVNQMGLWTGLLSDKLQQDLRETQGLAYSVGAYVTYKDGWGWLTLQIGTRADNIPQALEGMKEWIGKLQNIPLDKSELEKVQASQRGRALMRRMARDQQAFQLGLAAMKGEDPFEEEPAMDPNPDEIGKTARELLESARWIQIVVE